jgi:predicted dehydrogenase
MEKVKYGIVSTAQVVPRFIEAVRLSGTGEVVAIASRGIEKAQVAADEWGVPKAYGSYEELYEDPEVDIIYIATYNKGHYPAAKGALFAGKNVLLEKPFTLALDQAKELFALAEEKGLFLMEAQKSIFLPVTKRVRDIIQSGAIGEVVFANSITAYPNIDHVGWFRDLDAGGGTLHFSAPYPIEYLTYVLDDEIVDYTGVAEFSKGTTDSQSDTSLKFKSGAIASIFITTHTWIDRGMRIIGTKGEINIPDFWKTDNATVKYEDGSVEDIHLPFKNEFTFEAQHVNELIQNGQTSSELVPKEMTLKTVEIIEGLYDTLAKD